MKKKVLVFGKFDILHPGHMYILSAAKKLGDVTVILESDQSIKALRHYTPYNSESIRKHNLENMGWEVFVRDTQHDRQYIINNLKPDILCLGEDQIFLLDIFSNFKNLKVIKFFKSNLYKSSHLRSILEDKSASVYLINKPKGVNSFKAVSVFRKVLNIKRVGFSGTLDPLASGLMIVATGQATRLLDWFHDLPKTYRASILFGQTSDTYDLEGKITINPQAKAFGKEILEKQLIKFLGPQKQRVPIYSAKKIKGQKLYKLARAGRQVKAPIVNIKIYDFKIDKFRYPNLQLTVSVSAGTYIRSLAGDLGEAMRTGALLSDLERVSIGDFDIKESLVLDKVTKNSLLKYRIEPKNIIESLNEYLRR